MSCNYYQLPHSGIQSLIPYVPGKSAEAVAKEEHIIDIVKLASNENPLGCSPLAKEALTKLSIHQLSTYPIHTDHPLKKKLSKKIGIAENMLTLGNGSDALFTLLLTAFALHTDKMMLTHEYAFSTYHIQAQTLGIPTISISVKSDWQVDIDALIAATTKQKIGLLFLANPNNPTGLHIPLQEIQRLLAALQEDIIVILDEAYYEYAYSFNDKTSIELLKTYSNLVITRTFSKAYGLAGLRVGYAIANPEITNLLHRIELPFSVNKAGLDAAYAALDDEMFLHQTIECNKKGMQEIQQGLDSLKLRHFPSNCNFITFDCQKDCLPIYQKLLTQGVIVRPLHPYGLSTCIRVTIGNTIQNKRFLDKLAVAMNQ